MRFVLCCNIFHVFFVNFVQVDCYMTVTEAVE